MPGQHVPRRVKDSKVEKLSTQLFDYQIELIKDLSKSTGWSNGIIYRYAIDYFIVCFKDSIKAKKVKGKNIKIPKELKKMTEPEIRELPEFKV